VQKKKKKALLDLLVLEIAMFTCKVHKSNKNLPHTRVQLKVESERIVITDAKKGQVLAQHDYAAIVSWASSSGTFAYEVTRSEAAPQQSNARKQAAKDQQKDIRFLFMTKEGSQIADAIQKSVQVIVEREEREFAKEEREYRAKLEFLDKQQQQQDADDRLVES
jgi:PTB domain (IRS-1 type)